MRRAALRLGEVEHQMRQLTQDSRVRGATGAGAERLIPTPTLMTAIEDARRYK